MPLRALPNATLGAFVISSFTCSSTPGALLARCIGAKLDPTLQGLDLAIISSTRVLCVVEAASRKADGKEKRKESKERSLFCSSSLECRSDVFLFRHCVRSVSESIDYHEDNGEVGGGAPSSTYSNNPFDYLNLWPIWTLHRNGARVLEKESCRILASI